jgi:hypothetical protein
MGAEIFNATLHSPAALIARDEFRELVGSVPLSHWK